MTSIRDITVKDILENDPVTVNVGQSLSQARNKMEEHAHRTVAVVDGKKFVGMIGYREMMQKFRADPSITQVESLTHTPPEIDEEQNLVELADLRINSGRKKFALIGEHDRLDGVISERDIVYAAKDTEELQNLTVEDLMTHDLITINEDTSHETARSKMMDNNISRLPVVNDGNELVGVITFNELLRGMIPRDQMTEGDYKHHKESLSDIPVSELMNALSEDDAVIVDDSSTSIADVIDTMHRQQKVEAVVTAGDTPVGILTLKDIIDHLASFEEVESIRIDLAGTDVPQEKAAIHEKVETAIRGSFGRVLDRPEELKIHVKQYEKDGKRHKYSLNFKLSSQLGLTTTKAHGWDLLNVVDEGLDELEKIVKKEKEKTRDEHREREREDKYR